MKHIFIFVCILSMFSCATGPVYIATQEQEGIKRVYKEEGLKRFFMHHENLLRRLYMRLSMKKIEVCKEGLGYTIFNEGEKKSYYLMIYLRPREIFFDENSTKAEERLSNVLTRYLLKYYVETLREEDFIDEIDGVAFGIFWPVRDFSQCKEHGGFIEYVIVYFRRQEAIEMLHNNIDYLNALRRSEILTSLETKEEKRIRITF